MSRSFQISFGCLFVMLLQLNLLIAISGNRTNWKVGAHKIFWACHSFIQCGISWSDRCYGLTLHVSCATHDAGGMHYAGRCLHAVRSSDADGRLCRRRSVRPQYAAVNKSLLCPPPVYTTSTRRTWRSFNPDQFQTDLQESALCDDRCWQGLDGDALGQLYDDTITRLDNQQIPVVTKTCRRRSAVLPTHGSATNAAKPNGYLKRKNLSLGVLDCCPTLARQLYRHGHFNVDNTSVCCMTKRL